MARYDLLESERHQGTDRRPGLVPIPITPEQARALCHVATSPDLILAGLVPLEAAEADAQETLNRTLIVEAYCDDGWMLVNYAWNPDGEGAWLAGDGGWHFGPDEDGFYPWKEKL